jgi:hypothetical protein
MVTGCIVIALVEGVVHEQSMPMPSIASPSAEMCVKGLVLERLSGQHSAT